VRRAFSAAFLLGSLVLVLSGCGTGGLAEPGSVSNGKALFTGEGTCSSCHTLAHAGAQGKIGPNLDAAFAVMRDEDYPLSTIRNIVAMQIKYPTTDPATGAPGMPAHLVKGSDVDDIASYVACAAGIPVKAAVAAGCGTAGAGTGTGGGGGAGGGGGGGSTDGKAIFSSAGCVSCHTLKAAGATGTVGPNLDQSTIDEAGAIHQVTNGGGVMPAFKDQLSEEQIKAVAHFVVTERGK
jgi:mono/diheme cytochrome c family protein